MPRRPRRPPRRAAPPGETSLRGGWVRVEPGEGLGGSSGQDWVVRSVSGTAAAKDYRCPGCDQEIRAGVPHVVAWPAGEHEGSVERRHWHTGCWRRARRR